MKVLHVNTHFNIGGISNYILTLASQLKSLGVEVVVASNGGNLERELAKRGIPHRHLNIKTKFEFAPGVLLSSLAISNMIKSEGIDIVHAHSRVSQVASMLASKATGVKFITTCHGYFQKRLRSIIDTWGMKVIAISGAVKDHLVNDLDVEPSRVELIYSGVDADRFAKDLSEDAISEAKKSLGLKEGPVVGTVGRLSSVKGQKFLIEAMKDIARHRPDAQAVLLGNGDEESCLKELARSFGVSDNIHFYESSSDTHKFLQIMDVFVFPSIKEGLGIALLEAMASGRPCVASRVGGIGNIIEEGKSGLLVDVGDAPAIGNAVLRLLSDDHLRGQMGARGRAIVRAKFTLQDMASNVVNLYNTVIADKATS